MKKVIQQFYWLTTFFGFIEDKVIEQRWLRRKIVEKCLEILRLLYDLHILASDQKKFCFFRAAFEQLSIQRQLLIIV